MDEFVKQHTQITVEETLKSLRQHGFGAEYFATKDDVVNFIMNLAEDCKTVGIAGTHTVRALGVVSLLQNAGKTVYDHWVYSPGTPEELQCRRNQMVSDLFLSSANAITTTGEIVNKDGAGNRINAMTFGPKQVCVVAGVNKIVPDIDAALGRIETTAAPIRAMSLNRKTPCAKTGVCMDCDSPERICRITSIIHRKPMFTPLTVVIIGEELGY
ncbi:MAG: lactate utilization protein [Thermodesulfobacteriota bacterium]